MPTHQPRKEATSAGISLRLADLPRLLDVEAAAGELFRTVGMPTLAEDPPEFTGPDEAVREQRVWVAEVRRRDRWVRRREGRRR